MDPTLKEVYDLVLDQWPLVAGAYAILWTALVVYIGMALGRLGTLKSEMKVLEEAIERRAQGQS
jgi:hypothetical protein